MVGRCSNAVLLGGGSAGVFEHHVAAGRCTHHGGDADVDDLLLHVHGAVGGRHQRVLGLGGRGKGGDGCMGSVQRRQSSHGTPGARAPLWRCAMKGPMCPVWWARHAHPPSAEKHCSPCGSWAPPRLLRAVPLPPPSLPVQGRAAGGWAAVVVACVVQRAGGMPLCSLGSISKRSLACCSRGGREEPPQVAGKGWTARVGCLAMQW